MLGVGARLRWVWFASHGGGARRREANRRRAVRVRSACYLVRERPLAAVRTRCLDQRVSRRLDLVRRMARYPRLRTLPPDSTLGLARTRQRRRRDLHHVRVHLPLCRAPRRRYAHYAQQTFFHHGEASLSGACRLSWTASPARCFICICESLNERRFCRCSWATGIALRRRYLGAKKTGPPRPLPASQMKKPFSVD